jgi:cell fate regulator YaaT (PSP1 superfamily)
MRMVKNQKLPMDMNKITGLCGRLLCCLSYEEELYGKERIEKK